MYFLLLEDKEYWEMQKQKINKLLLSPLKTTQIVATKSFQISWSGYIIY